MSADTLVVQTLLKTCQQLRRLAPAADVAASALKREQRFAAELKKLTEAETEQAQPEAQPVAASEA